MCQDDNKAHTLISAGSGQRYNDCLFVCLEILVASVTFHRKTNIFEF